MNYFLNKYRPLPLLAGMWAALFASLMLAVPQVAAQQLTPGAGKEVHRQAIEAWRRSRHAGLIKPDSWLTLVGLEWLKEGQNRVGSAADNDIRITNGPDYWGSVYLESGQLRFVGVAGNGVMIDGESLTEAVLVPDTEGKPTTMKAGTVSFYAIFRESFALRIKDSQARALLNFRGVENYPIEESWRIDGRFVRAAEGATIEIVNVLGQIDDSPVFGTFEFENGGKSHSIVGLGTADSENLWFIFADRTNGHDTYGAGRFLYSDAMPENGRLTVDFNKAYNPPCAFNPYSTCPLPPQRNRMDLKVTAGERDFHPDSS